MAARRTQRQSSEQPPQVRVEILAPHGPYRRDSRTFLTDDHGGLFGALEAAKEWVNREQRLRAGAGDRRLNTLRTLYEPLLIEVATDEERSQADDLFAACISARTAEEDERADERLCVFVQMLRYRRDVAEALGQGEIDRAEVLLRQSRKWMQRYTSVREKLDKAGYNAVRLDIDKNGQVDLRGPAGAESAVIRTVRAAIPAGERARVRYWEPAIQLSDTEFLRWVTPAPDDGAWAKRDLDAWLNETETD